MLEYLVKSCLLGFSYLGNVVCVVSSHGIAMEGQESLGTSTGNGELIEYICEFRSVGAWRNVGIVFAISPIFPLTGRQTEIYNRGGISPQNMKPPV